MVKKVLIGVFHFSRHNRTQANKFLGGLNAVSFGFPSLNKTKM